VSKCGIGKSRGHFFLQDKNVNVDFHFTLGIQIPWQLRCIMHVEAGHNETISMNVTFGPSNVKFLLFTLLGEMVSQLHG
jgi:hypothetical protein